MTNKNVPKLRFSEYTDEWELYSLDDLTTAIQSGKSNKNINAMYNLYGSTGCIGKTNSIEIKGESILIARVGANAGTVQYINDICGVSDNTLIIKLKNDLNYKFLYYSLIIYNFNKIIVNSGRPLITASDLKTIRIQIPSIDEQKKIACFLYNIDKKIELLKDKKEGFVEFKHYLLQNLFPQNDEKTPKLRFTEYNDEWITRKIENIAEICDGTHTTPNYVNSGIKFISVENIDDFSKSSFLSSVDKKIDLLDQEIELVEEYKKGLLQKNVYLVYYFPSFSF
ncbi:restriction endonuclease subunit S [Methanosphaera sp.]|uniref:restriction endonuclease subunit S n=1 Tax=Methanosphaera sp. TaxID=2666342 RepID=UPI003D906447